MFVVPHLSKPLLSSSFTSSNQLAVPNFADSKLEDYEVEDLLNGFRSITFPAGYCIARTGEHTTQALYLQLDGKIQNTDEEKGLVSVLTQGAHFGALTLQYTGAQEDFRSPSTIEAVENTKCFMLDRKAIEKVFGSLSRLGKPQPPAPCKLDQDMVLEDLILHQKIGEGSFGRVWLAQHIVHLESIYAVKVMDKQEIFNRNMHQHVKREKNVLASIHHPFIVNLVAAFQDDTSLYLIQDFLQGGELDTLLYRDFDGSYISNDSAVFYSACILEALSHMHHRNICYRDLKLENVLLDKHGYCVLIDMGFAKVVVERTHTMCGSPEYMAPEVILGTGV